MKTAPLLYVLFCLLAVTPGYAADMEKAPTGGKRYRLVSEQGKVIAEFPLSEEQDVMIFLENGEPQVRSVDAVNRLANRQAAALVQQASNIERAKILLRQKEYDAVISLLSSEAYRQPNDFELNLLLARAEVEKSEQQKERGDASYKQALQSIYQRGQRLHSMNRTHPEPYYIVAKSLYLNNRGSRGYDTVRKAIYYAPHDPNYQLLYGDLSVVQAEFWEDDKMSGGYVKEMYQQALTAYEAALAGFKDDEEQREKVRARIDRIQERLSKR